MHRYIKAAGAGQKRARALTREEARAAMGLIAAGQVDPVQVGAFLLALRMKGETADELAGFTDVLTAHTVPIEAPAGTLAVDGHGDGHVGIPSLLPAAMCAASALGVPVCLGVDAGSRFARHGLAAGLRAIGLDGALDPARASRDLATAGVAACDLALTCPPLAKLVALRPLLGVRTAAQTLAKLVSPLGPLLRLVGIFHAPYLEPTAAALGRLGVSRGLVVQALGGLPEARPGKLVRVAYADAARATPIDLRGFGAPEPEDEAPPHVVSEFEIDLAAAEANREALDGHPVQARRAAAAAALLLHAASGGDPESLAGEAFECFVSGRARTIAARLG
ncbi:MAG: hypothetical protein EXR72_00635 [Myxococcales bacterium]|nr:hypothetical protein [Myxococcales bacterium]